MGYFSQACIEAFRLIFSLDRDVYAITFTSLKVSTIAVACATLTGVPAGFALGISTFRWRGMLITLLNTFMALPTVVIGLLGYAIMSRRGPLGPLHLLFTPSAMIAGQYVLALPIIMALTISAIQSADPRIRRTAIALGATNVQSALTVFVEARFALMSAIIAGFGRIIGEVGASMMLGGNIKGHTRSLSTAIALETSKGEFGFGLALGIILMTVALSVNFLLRVFQQKR